MDVWMGGGMDGTYVPVSRPGAAQKSTRCFEKGEMALSRALLDLDLVGRFRRKFNISLHARRCLTANGTEALVLACPVLQRPALPLERRHATVQSRAAKQHLTTPFLCT